MKSNWFAVAYGAIDVREVDDFPDLDIVIVPTLPSHPIGISGMVSALWYRLINESIDDSMLNEWEKSMLLEFEAVGIASREAGHIARVSALSKPWMSSAMHELVYALISSLLTVHKINAVFIKGQYLQEQGIRTKKHSGDVDVVVRNSDILILNDVLKDWGWTQLDDVWEFTQLHHSITLVPSNWGCEIDLHRYFPGVTISTDELISLLNKDADQVKFASKTVSLPSIEKHTVLYALHEIRPIIGSDINSAKLDEIRRLFEKEGRSVITVARLLGAETVLSGLLMEAFSDFEPSDNQELPANWSWRKKGSKLEAYLEASKQLPGPERMKAILRFVWPRSEVALKSDSNAGGSARGVATARYRRMLRGIRDLLRSIK